MAKYRQGRINDAVAQELALALRDVRDPRIVSNMVSITRADVTKDLKIAKVYFSSMGDPVEAKRALTGAAGLFRCRLAASLNLRITPELSFIPDGSIEHGARISELLREIDAERAAREAATDENGGDEK
ncbi:MAG: 30S ribosome-binding factor RbfA [Clostridia bacterium]|nr:30S ribosome-binding factor RbfA [Clostridia bacterium]